MVEAERYGTIADLIGTPTPVDFKDYFRLVVCGALLLAAGCDSSERISRLEKQTLDLQAEVKRNEATADYDLQAKCSRDAKNWFNDNWSRDKETEFLNYTNHYDRSLNKCSILVEYHYSLAKDDPSWINNLTLWNVYENTKYGDFSEHHYISYKVGGLNENKVIGCVVAGAKCKTIEEFNNSIRPYLSD